MSLTKQETAGGFQSRLDDDENDDEILKYIASPDTLEDSRMGTSPLSTSHRAAVFRAETSAGNGMVPEASARNISVRRREHWNNH